MSKNQAWTVWRNVTPWELKPTQSNMSSVISFLESWLVAQPQQHSLIALPSLKHPPLSHWVTHLWSYQRWRLPVSQKVPPRNANSKESPVAWQNKDLTNLTWGVSSSSIFSARWGCDRSNFVQSCDATVQHFTKLPPKKKVVSVDQHQTKKGFINTSSFFEAASTSDVCRKLRLRAWRQGGKVSKWRQNLEESPGSEAESASDVWLSQRILNFLHESYSSSMVSTHEFYSW